MKPTDSSTNTTPYFVGSYVEANNNYTSGSGIGIASAIYPATDSDLRSADFPYRQIIRGDGACYLNACLVGILNKCVGDAEKWEKFKKNVNDNYGDAKEIINQIELRAKTQSPGTSQNGLDRKKLNQMLQEKGEGNLGTQLAKKILIKEHQELINEYDKKIAQQHQVIEEAESNKIKYTTDYLDAFNRYLQTDDGKKLIDQTLPTFGINYEDNITIMKEHFKKIHDHQMSPINGPDQNGPFMALRELAGNPSAPVDKTGSFESIPKKINGAKLSINTCAIYRNYISESNDDFATSYEESMIEPIVDKLTLGMINQGQSLDIHTFEDTYFQNPEFIQNFDPNAIYLHNADGVSHFNLIYSKVDPICTELNEINIQTTKTREDKKIKEQNDKSGLVSEISELQIKPKLDVESDELIKLIINNKKLIHLDLTSLQLIKSIYEASTEKAQESKTKVKKEAQKILSESKTAGASTKTSTPQDNQLDPEICFQLALEEIIKNNEPNQELFETYLQAIKEGDQATKDEKFQRQLSHTAAKKGKSNFIAPLIKILPDSFKTIEYFDNTPLMWAIANAENKFAFDLLTQAQGVDIGINHISEQLGTNALHLATAKGYTGKNCDGNDVGIPNSELVKKLIKNDANPNIETTSGLSALDIGVLRADSELVELILSSQKIEKHTILKAIRKIDSIKDGQSVNLELEKICGNVFKKVTNEDVKEEKKEAIKKKLTNKLLEIFPDFEEKKEDQRKVGIIIKKQLEIFNQLFEQNRVKKDKKKSLKDHVGEGMDWWVFPGYTNNNDPDKFTATKEIYTRLARNPEYCKRYKTFIYQYMDSFDIDEKVTHIHRFSKLVESLIGMTSMEIGL